MEAVALVYRRQCEGRPWLNSTFNGWPCKNQARATIDGHAFCGTHVRLWREHHGTAMLPVTKDEAGESREEYLRALVKATERVVNAAHAIVDDYRIMQETVDENAWEDEWNAAAERFNGTSIEDLNAAVIELDRVTACRVHAVLSDVTAHSTAT
jgi:hypothetical protein